MTKENLFSLLAVLLFFIIFTPCTSAFTRMEIRQMSQAGVRVQLPGESRPGRISSQLSSRELRQAKLLDFSNVSLYLVPSWLGEFRNLRKLDLSNNKLSADSIDDLLSAISNMSRLDVLNLSGNPLFQGGSGESLGRLWSSLPELSELYLRNIGANGEQIGSLAPLSKLYRLDLSGNSIDNISPLGLSQLGYLELLNLSSNNIRSFHPSSYAGLSRLRKLNLASNRISSMDGGSLAGTNLKELDLSQNQLTDIAYVKMPRLEVWNLQGNGTIKLAAPYNDLFTVPSLRKFLYDSGSDYNNETYISPDFVEKMRKNQFAGNPRCSQYSAERAPYGKSFTDSTTGMEFIWVPGGCFMMGSENGGTDEKPVHLVALHGFYIGKYEVTNGQYRKFQSGHDSGIESYHGKSLNGNKQPVVRVSWDDTREYAQWLSRQSGKGYRLPTEAEWEYAARSGGKAEKYPEVDDLDQIAWYSSNSGDQSHNVGTKVGNGLGIYDMSGNVGEWCQDVMADDYKETPTDGSAWEHGGEGVVLFRVTRGGSWGSDPDGLRAAYRGCFFPGSRSDGLGFRLSLPVH